MENCGEVNHVGNLTRNSQPMRNKKIEKIHNKEKQLHAQDNIYMVWQITYVHRVTRISLFSRKNTSVAVQCFNLLKTTTIKTLITKIAFSTSCAQDSQWATKWAKKFSRGRCPRTPKKLVHERSSLSLST